MTSHEQMVALFETYVLENQRFTEKKIKNASSKARRALLELGKLIRVRRTEIREEKAKLIEQLAAEKKN